MHNLENVIKITLTRNKPTKTNMGLVFSFNLIIEILNKKYFFRKHEEFSFEPKNTFFVNSINNGLIREYENDKIYKVTLEGINCMGAYKNTETFEHIYKSIDLKVTCNLFSMVKNKFDEEELEKFIVKISKNLIII